MKNAPLEQLATTLSASLDYRVLRRLVRREVLATDPGTSLLKGVVVDTETTGLDARQGKIIEIGLVAFEYDPVTGQPIRILDAYGALEDPGAPLSTETTAITGITNDMVAGQCIDEARVASLVDNTHLVVAHNAEFDRPFLENRFPVFAELPWGCSLTDIDWISERLGSRKLDYIAFKMGFFFDAHRAEEDCLALLEILSRPLPVSGIPALKRIVDQLGTVDYTLYTSNAPYASKDLLKARQYRWDGELKQWHRTVSGSEAFDAECAWLKTAIYGGSTARIEVLTRDARTRFSKMPAARTIHTI